MNQLWHSFIPYHVTEDFHAHPGLSPIGRVQRFPAVILFSDVSGFTNISEALAQFGRQGAEELTIILNSYFTPMIDLIKNYGGIVGKFGGDAITAVFPFTSQTQQAATRRAIQCAVDMQASMKQYEAISTRVGTFNLAMKAGLAAGTLVCTIIGDPDIRLEYIIAGSALDESAEAEHHANRGEVMVANALLPYAGQTIIHETRGQFTSISRLVRPAPAKPLPKLPPLPEESLTYVRRFVHPSIASRIQQEQEGFVNEHRKVTVIFARFNSFDYDTDPNIETHLQQYLAQVVQITQRYDGYLNKIDMGDKGSKYIVLFGTPISHEDDEERALHCALELRQIPGPSVRIGIDTGFVYCGQVGSPLRQEYTVMGDTVNMAARMMQAAATNQILISQTTWESVADSFVTTPLPPMHFKGKSKEHNVFAVERVKQQRVNSQHIQKYELPLVGRKEEFKKAEVLLKAAQEGRGQVLGVTAQAGMGKSRFSSEIIQYAAELEFTVHIGEAQSYGTTTQYLVWRSIWHAFFNIADTAAPDDLMRQLAATLAQLNPRLKDRLPLLSSVLNLAIPENDLTISLEPQMRADLLKTLLLECLRYRSRHGPLLLVLEDCHWMDDLSQELLAFIGHNLADLPILLLTLYRPDDSKQSPLSWADQTDPVSNITLREFNTEEAETLARLKLQQLWQEVPLAGARLLEHIITQAQGNPFYLEEIVNYIYDQKIHLDDEKALDQLDIPDSLHNLIMSRIDQLPDATQTTLKVASVIGRVFDESWIWGSYAQAGSPGQVKQHLENLRRLDLTPLYQEETEATTYIFKHVTTQEVAYESLAYATRGLLHERVGHYIELAYEENLTQHIDILAHHYGRSPNTNKQRLYFQKAAEIAQKAYANQAAIDYYQRLFPLLSEGEQSPVLHSLAQVHQLIGEWQEAETLYHKTMTAAQENGQIAVAANAALALGRLLFLSNPEASEEALDWLQQARQQFEQIDDRQGIGRVLERFSFIYSQQGRYDEALTCGNQQLQIARQFKDPIGVSTALNFIGEVHFMKGNLVQAEATLKEAVSMAQDADYKRGIIMASNDLAGVYWQLGNFHQSLAYLQQSQTISQEIGDEEGREITIGNAGLLYHHLGQEEEALSCLLQALAIAIMINDWANIANLLGNLGLVLHQTGQSDLALTVTDRAIELNRSLNTPYFLSEFLQHKATMLAEAKNFSQAMLFNEEALQIAQRIEHSEIQFEAELLAVHLRLWLGEIDMKTAVNAFRQLAAIWLEKAEQAAIYYEIAKLTSSEDARQRAAFLYQKLYKTTPKAIYQQRYETLTGVRLPDFTPLPPPPQFIEQESLKIDDLLKRVSKRL